MLHHSSTFLPVSRRWSSNLEEIWRVVYSVSAAVPAPQQLTERRGRERERERNSGGGGGGGGGVGSQVTQKTQCTGPTKYFWPCSESLHSSCQPLLNPDEVRNV